jgi:tetratricopeptide (TPR) repeat protein
MKNIYIIFVFISILYVTPTLITAQSNIPTLKAQLRLSNADSSQLYYELGKEYSDVNLDSCFYYLNTSLALAERQNNAFGVAQAMHRIGYTYVIYKRNDGKAVEWLNKAIAVAKKTNDNLNLARSYQYLGLIAHYQNSNKADELLTRALTYAKASKDWEVLTNTYDIMATYYSKQKRFKEAEAASHNAMVSCEAHSPDSWLSYGLDYVEQLIAQDRKEEAYMFCFKLAGVKDKLKKPKVSLCILWIWQGSKLN